MDFFPGVGKGGRAELGISDQGSWNAALMMAQGNRPNEGTFAGLLVVAIDAESDENHWVQEEVGPDYTGEEEDEREPPRNNRPEDLGHGGEGPSQPSTRPRPSQPSTRPRPSRKGKERAIDTGDNDGDGDLDQDGNDHDDGDEDDGDDDDDGDGGNDDLYSRPGK